MQLDYPRLVGDMEHYELSRKTKSRKGEQMKRLALLSVFSLLLASAVFAPVAMAQVPGEVDVQSVTLGPGGSVTATGTIQCTEEGYRYFGTVEVRQRTSGNVYNTVGLNFSGTCEAGGPTAFTASGFSDRPFHRGPATVRASSTIYSPDFSSQVNWSGDIAAVHIR